MERDIVLQKVTPIKPNFMGSQPITVYAPNINNPIKSLSDGKGSGSVQQTGYTQEGVYEDFKHYAAAYGIAMAQGLDSVEAIEQLMNAYTYEQLLDMIAQANFGGNTEQAQAYLYGMIDQVLSDNNLEFLPNKVNASASTALGVGNKVWSPCSFVSGYNNIVGRKGYPLQAAFSATIGSNIVNNGANAIVVGQGDKENGKPLVNNGDRSIVSGHISKVQLSTTEAESDKDSVRLFKKSLAEVGLITNEQRDDDTFAWYNDGNHSSGDNYCFDSYIHEDAAGGNVAFSRSVIAPGGTLDGRTVVSGNNFSYGWWTVVSGKDNAVFGVCNTVIDAHACFIAGARNKIKDEYINGFNNNSAFGVENTILSSVAATTIGFGNSVEYSFAPFVAGAWLKAETGGFSYSSVPHVRLGSRNEDKAENVFEFGIGTSENNRKNGMWLDKSGNFGVAGDLTIGGKTAATQEWVQANAGGGGKLYRHRVTWWAETEPGFEQAKMAVEFYKSTNTQLANVGDKVFNFLWHLKPQFATYQQDNDDKGYYSRGIMIPTYYGTTSGRSIWFYGALGAYTIDPKASPEVTYPEDYPDEIPAIISYDVDEV